MPYSPALRHARSGCKKTSHTWDWEIFHPDSSSYLSSIMEALGGYPTKSSASRSGLIKVLLSVAVCMGSLYLLQSKLSKSRKPNDFYSYEVKDARGRAVSLEKYRGKVSYAISQAQKFCFKWFYIICEAFENGLLNKCVPCSGVFTRGLAVSDNRSLWL